MKLVPIDAIAGDLPYEALAQILYLEKRYFQSGGKATTFAPETVETPTMQDIRTSPRFATYRHYKKKSPGARHLIIANGYPSISDRYSNGFVHRRAIEYQRRGIDFDVIAVGKRLPSASYTYEGINVLQGYVDELNAVLATGEYETISVHFLNSEIWNILNSNALSARLLVYIHGYEARRWSRTPDNYASIPQLQNAIARTSFLQSFWHTVLASEIVEHFIFVSNWAYKAVESDMEISFPKDRVSVIPNYIDGGLFSYAPKSAEARFKILWIRTANAMNYGHDLAIQAVRKLLDSPSGKQFEIEVWGGGRYFPEFSKALGDYSNVTVGNRFLSQEEIAAKHQSFGIFMVPTRMDTQGVSRDEAMSSGLVPATNQVAAVPEFVDDDVALIAPPEDSGALASSILSLIADPDRFLQMSHAAHQRASHQCGPTNTILREISLMEGKHIAN
jgi:glycosyltransferase involved in cell wall biosynthesis